MMSSYTALLSNLCVLPMMILTVLGWPMLLPILLPILLRMCANDESAKGNVSVSPAGVLHQRIVGLTHAQFDAETTPFSSSTLTFTFASSSCSSSAASSSSSSLALFGLFFSSRHDEVLDVDDVVPNTWCVFSCVCLFCQFVC